MIVGSSVKDDVFLKCLFSSDKAFYASFFLSFIFHAGIIICFSTQNIPRIKDEMKKVELTYTVIEKEENKKTKMEFKDLGIVEEKKPKKKIEILTKEDDVFLEPDRKIRDLSKLSNSLNMDQPQTPKIKSFDIDDKVSIPIFQAEKITNPMYISHKQSIGQIIRRRAFEYIDHPDFSTGYVYLTFVLSADGKLKDVKIIEEKTSANEYIRNVALRSIRESAPFPPFPQGFEFPEVSFSLLIEFKDV